MAQCDESSIPLVDSVIQDDGEQLQRQEVVFLRYLNLYQSEIGTVIKSLCFLVGTKRLFESVSSLIERCRDEATDY